MKALTKARYEQEWHTCDICRKDAADKSLPMLGAPKDHFGQTPRVWVCSCCRPAFTAKMARWLTAPEGGPA